MPVSILLHMLLLNQQCMEQNLHGEMGHNLPNQGIGLCILVFQLWMS